LLRGVVGLGFLWWGFRVGVCVWQCGNKIIRKQIVWLSYCIIWDYGNAVCLTRLFFCRVAFYFCVDLLIPVVTGFELEYGGILYG